MFSTFISYTKDKLKTQIIKILTICNCTLKAYIFSLIIIDWKSNVIILLDYKYTLAVSFLAWNLKG